MNYLRITGVTLGLAIIAALAYPLHQFPEKVKPDSTPKAAEDAHIDELIPDTADDSDATTTETRSADTQTPKSLSGASPKDLTLLKLRNSNQYFHEKRRQKALENGETLPLYESKEEMKQITQSIIAERVKEVLIKKTKGN